MHYPLMATILILCSISMAGLKIDAAYKMSETRLKEVQTLKAFAEKRKKTLEFKTALDDSLSAWEKESPQEASKDEEPVSLFFYTLGPVFDLAEKEKKTEKDCSNADLAIRAAASTGKPEGAPLSKNSSIALEWVQALCK